MSIMPASTAETQPDLGVIEDLEKLSLREIEHISKERAEARVNRCPEVLAREVALEKLRSFQMYVSGETDCDRSERFHAYYHIENDIHRLQHDAFLETFGIEGYSQDECDSPAQERIVKMDDPENPSVAIKRQLLAYDDGQVYGISYRGVRFGEQEQ